jgi:hypothetical protein
LNLCLVVAEEAQAGKPHLELPYMVAAVVEQAAIQ